ncbi:MAG: type VII secretion target [Mycobacterium kyogaense]|uniref:type VII secretion target n=1 Tax=Mycobacterium kyogaense TaxID=2212479 RepID=UPI002FFBDD8D
MSHVELGVTPAHLRELAAVQHRVAAEVVYAGARVVDAGAQVLASHGSIASGTAGALQSVQHARALAAAAVAARSGSLGEHLVGAAHRYEATDDASARRLK